MSAYSRTSNSAVRHCGTGTARRQSPLSPHDTRDVPLLDHLPRLGVWCVDARKFGCACWYWGEEEEEEEGRRHRHHHHPRHCHLLQPAAYRHVVGLLVRRELQDSSRCQILIDRRAPVCTCHKHTHTDFLLVQVLAMHGSASRFLENIKGSLSSNLNKSTRLGSLCLRVRIDS